MKRMILSLLFLSTPFIKANDNRNFIQKLQRSNINLEATTSEWSQLKIQARYDAAHMCSLPYFPEQKEMETQWGKIFKTTLLGGAAGIATLYYFRDNFPVKIKNTDIDRYAAGAFLSSWATFCYSYLLEDKRKNNVRPYYERALEKAEAQLDAAIEQTYNKILPGYRFSGRLNCKLQNLLKNFNNTDFATLETLFNYAQKPEQLASDILIDQCFSKYPLTTCCKNIESVIIKLSELEEHVTYILSVHDTLNNSQVTWLQEFFAEITNAKNLAKVILFTVKQHPHIDKEKEEIIRDNKLEAERKLQQAKLEREKQQAQAAQAQANAAYVQAQRERAERDRAWAEEQKATIETWNALWYGGKK
jgi:hypothetical protein